VHFLVSHALSRFASWSRSDEAYYPQVSSHQCCFQHYQDSPSTNDNAPFYHCCCCVFWFNMQWVIHSKVLDMWKNLASRSPLPRNTLDLDCANVGCVVPIFFSIQNPLFNVPFVADVLSDILLIGIPVRMLWRTRLPNNQRILILSIFATSIMMTCISIVHNIALFRNEIFQIVITGYLEVCSSHLSLTFIQITLAKSGRRQLVSSCATYLLWLPGSIVFCEMVRNLRLRRQRMLLPGHLWQLSWRMHLWQPFHLRMFRACTHSTRTQTTALFRMTLLPTEIIVQLVVIRPWSRVLTKMTDLGEHAERLLSRLLCARIIASINSYNITHIQWFSCGRKHGRLW